MTAMPSQTKSMLTPSMSLWTASTMITDGGADDQQRLDDAGHVLDLLVSVRMTFVGRLGGAAHRKKAISAAMRSEPECSASEMMAIEPDSRPATSLKTMRTEFEAIEITAARDLRPWSTTSSCGS